MSNVLYSIVVPVYKTSASLVELVKRVDSTFELLPNCTYEIIFVNDSPFNNKTIETLNKIVKNNENVVVVELIKNVGQQPATLCGIENAKGDYIITMDDDLQHAPEDIPKLILESQHDVVIANFSKKKHSLFKRITSNIKGYFDYIILGKPKHIKLSSFRLIKTEIAKLMFKWKTPYPFIPALLFSITKDIVNVKLDHYPRYDGKGNYTLIKLIKVFSTLLINNSSFLLRIIGYMGIAIAIIAFFVGLVIIAKKFFLGYVIPGWTSIMVAILFFGGMILFTLGIIGEYLIRIIATTEERPTYHIRKISDNRKI